MQQEGYSPRMSVPLTAVRHIYQYLPVSVRRALSPATGFVRRAIDPDERQRHRWLRDKYSEFGIRQREEVFLSIARFWHINRPSEGYYFEFGCHSGRTMTLAWKNSRHLFNWTYIGFDSFEGLPDIPEDERQEIWQKGKLKTSEDDFVAVVTGNGMPRDRLVTVKGFYDRSLNDELRTRLAPRKATAIYVDCDLYVSTVPVLEFCKDFLQLGTIIVFDDWNCFCADPDRGERRAFREFCERYPQLRFEAFYDTAETKSFVCVGV